MCCRVVGLKTTVADEHAWPLRLAACSPQVVERGVPQGGGPPVGAQGWGTLGRTRERARDAPRMGAQRGRSWGRKRTHPWVGAQGGAQGDKGAHKELPRDCSGRRRPVKDFGGPLGAQGRRKMQHKAPALCTHRAANRWAHKVGTAVGAQGRTRGAQGLK